MKTKTTRELVSKTAFEQDRNHHDGGAELVGEALAVIRQTRSTGVLVAHISQGSINTLAFEERRKAVEE